MAQHGGGSFLGGSISNILKTLEETRRKSPAGRLGQTNQQIQGRFDDLTDFGSDFFQGFRRFLGSVTPNPGVGSFLSLLQAGGGNFGASQVQAQASQRGAEGRRNDFLNTTTNQFALGAQEQANALLGIISTNQRFLTGLRESQRQFDKSQPGFLDFIGSILGTAGGSAAGGAFGGGAGVGGFGGFPRLQPSDIRLKENIYKVGKSPSGINIYEFNFKGSLQRYRGVIAQEVPEATKEINGMKYVDYEKIDVSFEAV